MHRLNEDGRIYFQLSLLKNLAKFSLDNMPIKNFDCNTVFFLCFLAHKQFSYDKKRNWKNVPNFDCNTVFFLCFLAHKQISYDKKRNWKNVPSPVCLRIKGDLGNT